MWQLSVRDEKRNWNKLGSFDTINHGAQRILELEGDKPGGEPNISLFFRVYTDPTTTRKSDAEILSRLEYQGRSHFYLLTRELQ